ncbi:MAG: hypothetical protein HOP19_16920, partial [Acidobacteria bacterium]|nr:hypothetical protein [Acidobacteriota bacterium]
MPSRQSSLAAYLPRIPPCPAAYGLEKKSPLFCGAILMNVCVVGTGYVGLVTGTCLA